MIQSLSNVVGRANGFLRKKKLCLSLLLMFTVVFPAVSQPPEERPDPPSSVLKPAHVPEKLRGHDYVYRVDIVLDGDSILLENGEELRLIGVDAPEKGDPYADAARETMRSLVPEESLIAVDFDRQWWDRYDRLLGYVYTSVPEDEGRTVRMLNVTLVKRGLAKTYLHKRNTEHIDRLIEAQRTAVRKERRLFHRIRETEDRYIQVRNHYRFHRPGCEYVQNIPGTYKRVFHTKRQALFEGYSSAPCFDR